MIRLERAAGSRWCEGVRTLVLRWRFFACCLSLLLLFLLGFTSIYTFYSLFQRWQLDMHVYTVAEIQDGLAHNPKAWIGRSLLVRGRIVQESFLSGSLVPRIKSRIMNRRPIIVTAAIDAGCLQSDSRECSAPQTFLPPPGIDIHLLLASATYPKGPILFVSPPPSSFLFDIARHIPVLSSIIPKPQRVHWGRYMIYRLHLLSKDRTFCSRSLTWPSSCDDATLEP